MGTKQPMTTETAHPEFGVSLADRIQNWWSGPHKVWEATNKFIASPHPSVTESGARSRASLQAWIAVTLSIFFILGSVASAAARGDIGANEWVLLGLTLVMAVVYVVSRSPYFGMGGWLITGSVVVAGYGFVITGQGSSSVLNSFIPLGFILGSILLAPLPMLFWVVIGVVAMFFVPSRFGLDVGTDSGNFMTIGALLLVAIVFRNSIERGRLAELRSANETLRLLQGGLEQRVAERTIALSSVAEVSTVASTILDKGTLLQKVVDLSKERFNFYHAHIYLLNEAGETLVLAAGAGESGHQMVNKGHSIPLNREQSLVARAARERKGVTVNDVTQEPDFLPNPLLPDTRSELAVPMIVGETVIGVFDVQSDIVGRFTESDIDIQTTLASQIAIAIQNANLYTSAEVAKQEAQSLVDYASEAIAILDLETGLFVEPNESASKLYGLPREELVKVGPAQMSPPIQPDGRDSSEKALEKINEAMKTGTTVFDWTHRNAQGQDIFCEIRLARLPGAHPRLRVTVTDISERKRIEEFNQQRARQQEALIQIAQKIQGTTNVEAALQITVRELGQALGKKASVNLGPSDDNH